MTSEAKYQLLDPLNEQQYADLKEDIAECGILQPVAVDEFGEVIDGHHRQRIAQELGIEYPTYQPLPAGAGDAEKLDAGLKLNLMGRKQTGPEKRETIKRYLLRRPEASNRHVARLVGCSDTTVASVRTELETGAQIGHVSDVRIGADGKTYPMPKRKAKSAPPDPEAVAKRQADLEKQRAKGQAKQAAKKAEEEEDLAQLVEDWTARGGSVRASLKTPARVVATQDQIKAAMNDCILALTRALQNPGLDLDLIRAEQSIAKDFQITAVHERLRKLVKEFGDKLKELKAVEKASRMERESPVREK